jgi:intracellular septation protein A
MKTDFETKLLLESHREVLFTNEAKLDGIQRFKLWTKLSTAILLIFIILLSVFLLVAYHTEKQKYFKLSVFGLLSILMAFTMVRGWSLIKI